MDERKLRTLLKKFREGKIEEDALLRELRGLPFRELDFAKVDHHRALRCGFPEVIFCRRKTTLQIVRIAGEILRHGNDLLATRATPEIHRAIRKVDRRAVWHEAARCVTIGGLKPEGKGYVLVVSAGTADIPVAEEARVPAEMLVARVKTLYDVGVAGIHRLLGHREVVMDARVVVCVAGMEGALASVIGGLVRRPVIAVPTSVGYGANFEGLATFLALLNSCASGVTTVNIDNGFGAGYSAALMARED
ncbi:MAG: nickel pincer cofactor biosynthesis protein LarB [Planctomycetota bacterium]|nr:MAG: nickel pincer cofactor biosynthesis protein LarB [Planctomycetota bacterium]